MFGYKSASHSLIAADGDDGKRSFGAELYFDCHRNSSLYQQALGMAYHSCIV